MKVKKSKVLNLLVDIFATSLTTDFLPIFAPKRECLLHMEKNQVTMKCNSKNILCVNEKRVSRIGFCSSGTLTAG